MSIDIYLSRELTSNCSINELKWLNHYNRLVSNARARSLIRPKGFYTEEHHILPRCIGGMDDTSNYVYLTAREHYIAHQLLAKIFPRIPKIVLAIARMSQDKDGNRLNNKKYEWVRIACASALSSILKGRSAATHEYIRRNAELRRGKNKK